MILDAIKSLFGIKSPSREFINASARRGRPSLPTIPAPWYAVRDPLDPYPSRELRDAARRVRRLVRRHWYALAFDYDGATAASVRAVMREPPVHRESSSFAEQLQKLEAFGVVEIDPELARKVAAEYGAQVKP